MPELIPAGQFDSWQASSRQPGAPFWPCSPNLEQLRRFAETEWGLSNLGCANRRPINGGTAWSSHAYGAALDLGYKADDRADIELILAFLIFNYRALGIQAVHDYWEARYWRSNVTSWINRAPGPKNRHIHIEVHPAAWDWSTTIPQRVPTMGGYTAPSKPAKYPGHPIKMGSKSTANVKAIQARLLELGYPTGPVDGRFGKITDAAVRRFQTDRGLTVDGIVGRQTWPALFGS